MAAEAAGDEASAQSRTGSLGKLSFLDLPAEAQHEILLHCSQSDLICVALVSKHFHELASSFLYRNFHIIFPDDDDINFDSPIDGLAGGLDTFTTSEYNYAKHLKDVSMDTLSSGVKGEHSYQSYLYSASCGKFLNTLLYLTLRKATALEAFRWNIRVELSRPVYRELHRIQSLKKLHIRMQAGESYYSVPPPLPVSLDTHAMTPSNHWPSILPPSTGPIPGLSPSLLNPAIAVPNGPPPPLSSFTHPPKSMLKNKASKRALASKEPSTLSGFKNLKSLSVLDIDDLDIVNELKTCIRNSSSTLTDLQLSFSDGLAMQARRPAPDSDPDESDVEDEFQVNPASHNSSYDNSGPAKAFRAQEERNIQEAVLGKILDVEPLLLKKFPTLQSSEKRSQSSEKSKEDEDGEPSKDPRDEFISSIRGASNKLMSLLNGSRDFTPSQEDILDTIAKAARKYVDSGDVPPATTEGLKSSGDSDITIKECATLQAEGTGAGQSSTPVENTEAAPATEDAQHQAGTNDSTSSGSEKKESGESSKLSKRKAIVGEVSPDDIDIEHLETVEDASEDSDDQQAVDSEVKTPTQSTPAGSGVSESTLSTQMAPASSASASSSATLKHATTSMAPNVDYDGLILQSLKLQEAAATLKDNIAAMGMAESDLDYHRITEAETQLMTLGQSVADLRKQIKGGQRSKPDSKPVEQEQSIKDYIRTTRGFPLETLSIHLVPVKASVLSRAVNLSCLKQLTLLNVGNQTAIWTLLTKENKETPLALRSVFTDHVTTAFLTCMSKLPELHELFLLERSTKQKPESFAPRGSTTIDQIRRLVLKKHMPTLKRLMIKDESNGPNWDVNEKAMIMMCVRGLKLEELAVSMNIHAVHAFMQYFSSLVSLRAIHILHFKNNDTCIWVMREILKFIVDNLSHNPELKLEWIAMEDERVDRVLRPSEGSEAEADEPVKKTSSGKAKVNTPPLPPPGIGFSDHFPALPVDGLDSESESETDDFDSGTRLRFKTVGPLQFYDVWGVRIFDKEIRSGRL